jgi:hypothetical protein
MDPQNLALLLVLAAGGNRVLPTFSPVTLTDLPRGTGFELWDRGDLGTSNLHRTPEVSRLWCGTIHYGGGRAALSVVQAMAI